MSRLGDADDARGARGGATADALLAQRAWLRRLAGSLVVDAAAADDLAQQALLVALQQPPAHAAHPRAWLATVVRRLAQRVGLGDARRDARERTAAPRESLPAADEVVARAEQQHAVSAALLALPEPYRATLLLRFVDDLPPRAIAKKKGVAVETVRTQLKRGLELLRERLVAARGGGTQGALALLGLLDGGMRRIVRRVVAKQAAAATGGGATAGGAAAIAAISGALWMSTKLKLAAALLVVAGGSFAIVQLNGGGEVPRSDAAAAARSGDEGTPTPVDAGEFALPAPVEVAAERAVVPPARDAEGAAEPATVVAPVTCAIEGTVVSATGAPVPGALVLLEDGRRGQPRFSSLQSFCRSADELRSLVAKSKAGIFKAPLHAICDSDGWFRIEGVAATLAANVAALHPEEGLGVLCGVAIDPLHPPDSLEIELVDGVVLTGNVTDPDGKPVAGAYIIVASCEGKGERRGGFPACDLAVGPDGSYRSLPLPYRDLWIECMATDHERTWRDVPAIPPDERLHREDFVLKPMRRIEGRLLAQDGNPARLRTVERELFFCGSNVEPNDSVADPRSLGGGKLDRANDRYSCKDEGLHWVSLWCDGVLLGRAEVKDEESSDGPDLVVDLSRIPPPERRASLVVEVVDGESGKPVTAYDVVVVRSRFVETASGHEPVRRAVVDENGRSEFADLLLGRYDVVVRAADYAPRFATLAVAEERSAQRVVLRRGSAPIAGRVIDEQGRAQTGIMVCLHEPGGEVALPYPDFQTQTNADGAFEFAALPDGDYLVVADAKQPAPEGALAPAALRVAAGRRDVELVMRQSVSVKLRFPFPKGVFPMYQMRVFDERGAPLIDDLRPSAWVQRAGEETDVRLPPGTCSVELFSPRHHAGPTRFTAAPGVVIDLDVVACELAR